MMTSSAPRKGTEFIFAGQTWTVTSVRKLPYDTNGAQRVSARNSHGDKLGWLLDEWRAEFGNTARGREGMTDRRSAEDLRGADPERLDDFERAWREYFLANPDVLASWGHQNGRMPPEGTTE